MVHQLVQSKIIRSRCHEKVGRRPVSDALHRATGRAVASAAKARTVFLGGANLLRENNLTGELPREG